MLTGLCPVFLEYLTVRRPPARPSSSQPALVGSLRKDPRFYDVSRGTSIWNNYTDNQEPNRIRKAQY